MTTERYPRAPRLTISVTDEIIQDAMPRHSSHCMIAEAVKVAYPGASHISVDIQTIRFTDKQKGFRYTYLTPRVGQVALVKFDQGISVEPFDMRVYSGQVTRAGVSRPRRRLTQAEQEQRIEALAKANDKLKRAKLVKRDGSDTLVPDKVGGKTPPLAPLARRRSFGLRALEA